MPVLFVFTGGAVQSPLMQRLLRILATVNAGVWFGSGLFLTAVVGPTFFSQPVTDLVGRHHAGLIAQAVLAKFFWLQLVCAAIAVGYLLYRTGSFNCRHLIGLVFVFAIVVAGGFWLQPKLIALNRERYDANTAEDRRTVVAREFGKWHGISQVGNLIVLLGSLSHLALLARGRRQPWLANEPAA
jgi:hypothetical protein